MSAEAISHYTVVEQFESTSLVEVRLHTGKRNQILAIQALLFAAIRWWARFVTPIEPDELRPIAFKRQALHAWRLGFTHPAGR